MAENFPNLIKDMNINSQEDQRAPNKMNTKRSIPRHVIVKLAKAKEEENLERSESSQVILSKVFCSSPTRSFGDQQTVGQYIQSAKRKNYQPTIFYLAKLSFESEEEIKTFSSKKKAECDCDR